MDNFELLALQSWSPSFASINQVDAHLAAPSDQVAASGSWAAHDFASVFPGKTYTLSSCTPVEKTKAFPH
jgi:hypothetical protein